MKPVTVSAHAFVFCRYTIAALVWVAYLTRSVAWLLAAGVLLGASAILKVERAPLIQLYSKTALRFYRSPEAVLDETAMRFAHGLGTAFCAACLGAVWWHAPFGWRLTLAFAALKSISALGFCPASKLFTCATNSSCCPLTKKALGVCQPKPNDAPRQ